MSSSTKLILPSGRPISLTMDIALFELDRRDWMAFFGLIDQIKATADTWRAMVAEPDPDIPTEPDTLASLGLCEADFR